MHQGPPVRLETERFSLRTLSSGDSTAPFQKWAADPEIMAPLNLPVRRLSDEQVRSYFAGFDNERKFLFGIFSKRTECQIGFWIVEINPVHATANWHLAIGERAYWGIGAPLELGVALLDWIFDVRGVGKVSATVPANNRKVRRLYDAVGWPLEGVLRAELRALSGEGRIDEFRYGLLKEDWPAVRARALQYLQPSA